MEKLNKKETKDIIASQIRALVYSGELKDGEEITQNEVAESLAVSRMPVREAFQLLSLEGLLTRLENRHVRVNGVKRENTEAKLKCLCAVELIALDYIKEMKEAKSEKEWHLLLSKHSTNPVISSNLSYIFSGYLEYYIENNEKKENLEVLNRVTSLFSENKREDAKKELSSYFDMLLGGL